MENSELKKGVILSCEYDKDWKAPNGDVIHWHTIKISTGDIGNVGVVDKYPAKIAVGAHINYTIKNNRIKLHDSENEENQSRRGQGGGSGDQGRSKDGSKKNQNWSKGGPKKLDDFLGYTFGYAKDLTIAQIQAGDKTALKDPTTSTIKHAHRIYAEIKNMLKEDWTPAPEEMAKPEKPAKSTKQ